MLIIFYSLNSFQMLLTFLQTQLHVFSVSLQKKKENVSKLKQDFNVTYSFSSHIL